MLFNSYVFIFLFLPTVFFIYFILNKYRYYNAAILFLFLASLFFYGYWNPIYIPLILASILVNYYLGTFLSKARYRKKLLLLIGITFNLTLLGYYKYSDFFLDNFNLLTDAHLPLQYIILPLGISFFSFTQIAFLVDAYHNKASETNFVNYGLFVTFFPHLLAGPILHHSDMMPQFVDQSKKRINYQSLLIGLMVFAIGLFKKACIADTLAEWVNNGYARLLYLSTLEAWLLSFSYTLQLYFDFSGYTDMAIGSSLMLNIRLPENFNSPYKALSIQDFWRRWHMTLSRWLRDYVYIPLGGNKCREYRIHLNLILTFLIGGIWHGAGWTYVTWGLLHGLAISVHRFWQKFNFQLPKIMAWALTFMFVNITWIFFRSESMTKAILLLKKMFIISDLDVHYNLKALLSNNFVSNISSSHRELFILLSVFFFISIFAKNSIELRAAYQGTLRWNLFIALAITIGILNLTRVTTFIYFQF